MDGPATMSEIRATFRTPLRILLPKLLISREDWKAKSHQRKAALKAAAITIRDLSASRDRWRQQTEHLRADNRRLQEQLDQADRDRAAVPPPADAQKK
jgi:hypothetical protein